MPAATQLFTSFLGGEISQTFQGRYDRPDYRTCMRVCLNSFPLEAGAWSRRPGTRYAGHTRRGAAARVIKFDFESSNAVTLEFTDGYLRFRSGAVLIDTNDIVSVSTVSTADPAVVTLDSAVDWATGDTAMFDGVDPMLQNRQFLITKVNTTHFSLVDALTNETIDGSTLGSISPGTMRRLHELTTSYTGASWSGLRAVQAETTDILLCATVPPQALVVSELPTDTTYAQFEIGDAVFNDGPYLDPFTSGVQATPSAKTGIISLSLSFAAYDSAKAYREGDFVSTGGVNYRSLADQNVGHAPASGAPWWTTASVSEAINDGRGFLGTDTGRLVRLFSEPAVWSSGTTYASGAVVSYNPTNLPGATQYWSSKAGSNTGHIPGSDLTWWELIPSNAAIWSWGRIIGSGFSNIIDRALAGSTSIGSMTSGGGLAAAFDGVFTQTAAASAEASTSGVFPFLTSTVTFLSNVGKNYSAATDQQIQQATVYPSSNAGFATANYVASGVPGSVIPTIVLNLRGKTSAPSSASDGTLLGTSGSFANTFSAVTIVSTDQTTAWKYVWIEQITTMDIGTVGRVSPSYTIVNSIAEISLFSPTGTTTSSSISVELLGPNLLYTTDIKTWRLGVYSDTTGWPTCGIYYEGRLWLGGAVKNRFDASVSNGIDGDTINFAPTDFTGAVAASNAISYTLNSNSVNKIVDFRADTPGLIACTHAAEFLILAPTTGPIAPANIAARQVTAIGSEDIPAARTEHTTVFVKRFGRKLIDYFADANFNKPSGQNLSDKAEHIVAAGIEEVAYASAVTPILWGRDRAGALFGITYKRDTLTTTTGPNFAAWHRHTLGTGRTVESLCVGPSVDGDLDTLTMVTSDGFTRHVELLTDTPTESAALADCWYLDGAVNPTSVIVGFSDMTINGLWHLNGQTVQVFAGGLDLGDPGEGNAISDFTVTDGSITIAFGDGVSAGPGRGRFTGEFAQTLLQTLSQIVVGLTYNSDGQAVRLVAQADTGGRNGPSLGAPSRSHRAALKFVNTKGVSIGGNFDRLYPCEFNRSPDSVTALPVLSTYSGIFFDQVRDDFTYDDSLCWRVSRPFPATITAVGINLRTEDM